MLNINIDYSPNWENLHVKKRLTKVLDWASQFIIGSRGSVVPVRLSSKILNQVFGPIGNPLGDYLRMKLIKQVSNSYSTELKRCKEYHVLKAGFDELAERDSRNYTLTAYVDTSALSRLKKVHAQELKQKQFKMHESSDRLWHPLQNLKRSEKKAFWKDYLPYNFDISACAPNILMQLAIRSGMPKCLADSVFIYVDTKDEFRERIARISGLSIQDSKRVINSLFNGARLAKNSKCAIYQLLDFDDEKMHALATDPEIIALRKGIKNCWSFIERKINLNQETHISLRKSKLKWSLYFKYERKVLNCVTRELDNQRVQYFTEHDGFRCSEIPDIDRIQEAIFKETNFRLSIKEEK